MRRPLRFTLFGTTMALAAVACQQGDQPITRGPLNRRVPSPDVMPTLLSTALPFRYPAPMYVRRVQGNVTLRLFIDADGRVVIDSTRIAEPSGYPSLDSAALAGAGDLHFAAAKLHGTPMPTSILFPVYFRHPEARPLPGDTILR